VIELLWALVMVPGFAGMGIILGLLYKGIDRRLAARMQARIGPPIRQPFTDVKKLLMKESVVPEDAVAWIFGLMPMVALAGSLLLLMYVPLFGMSLLGGYGDLIVVIYMLIFPSLALVIGGFASGSHYATVGAQREMVAMLSYEFPLAITAITIAWLMSMAGNAMFAFDIGTISLVNVWTLVGPVGALGLLMLLVTLIFVTTGELGAIPVDAAEAETEIAGGLLAEYSGRNLALFYLASAVKMVVLGSLVIALFLPFTVYQLTGIVFPAQIAAALNILLFLVKLFVVIFLSSTFIRVAVARFRITQVVKVYWGYATLLALLGLLLVGFDILLGVI
jgi:NADH-quinone oxidoreductase subunit H